MSSNVMSLIDLGEVAGRLRSLRGRLAEYQEEVVAGLEADVGLKITPRTYQNWEEGRRKTTLENYDLLCNFYGRRLGEAIPLDWLLYGRGTIAYERRNDPELEAIEQLRIDFLSRLDELTQKVLDERRPLKAVS